MIDGYLDMDGDGDLSVPDAGDDGTVAGFDVVDGLVDWNPGGAATDDDGALLSALYLTTTTDANGDYSQWGCWNTYFVDPQQDTMANGFLFQDQGAAAVLGATALTDTAMLRDFGQVFFDQVGRRDTLGEALLRAHRSFVRSSPDMADKLLGFALLGDPAIPLR